MHGQNHIKLVNMFNHNGMLAAAFKRAGIAVRRRNDVFTHIRKHVQYHDHVEKYTL